MSIKSKLRKLLLLSMIGFGSMFGGQMNPREIADLMRIMNQTQIEVTIPDERGEDDIERRESE